jgi:D-citramalate synthase
MFWIVTPMKKNNSRESYVLSCQGFETFNSLFKIDGEVIEEHAQGDGQFDAFMNALAKIYKAKSYNYQTD